MIGNEGIVSCGRWFFPFRGIFEERLEREKDWALSWIGLHVEMLARMCRHIMNIDHNEST